MQLQRLLDGVEDPADALGLRVAGDLLHVAVRQQIDVELGTDGFQRPCEIDAGGFVVLVLQDWIENAAQHRRVVARAVWHVVGRHDSGDARVHDGRAERILEGSDEDGLIDELVLAATQLADFLASGLASGRAAAG